MSRPSAAWPAAERSCGPPRARSTPRSRPSCSGRARFSKMSSSAAEQRLAPSAAERQRLAPHAAERLEELGDVVVRADLHRRRGRVSDLIGLIVEATGLEAEI